MDDYGLSAAQVVHDRNEGPNPFVEDKRFEPPTEGCDDAEI